MSNHHAPPQALERVAGEYGLSVYVKNSRSGKPGSKGDGKKHFIDPADLEAKLAAQSGRAGVKAPTKGASTSSAVARPPVAGPARPPAAASSIPSSSAIDLTEGTRETPRKRSRAPTTSRRAWPRRGRCVFRRWTRGRTS